MKRITTLTLTTVALLCLAATPPASDALAQQKQRLVFKVDAANTKYTQQHTRWTREQPLYEIIAAPCRESAESARQLSPLPA